MNTSLPLVKKSGRVVLLAFVVAAPLLFSKATVEAFEDVKSAALTLTALFLVVMGAAALSFRSQLNGRWLRQPLVVGVILFALSACVSTWFSLSSLTSWRGAFESHAGLTTLFEYGVLFFAARLLGDGRRLLYGVVVAAALTSTYALIQAARLDPLEWEGMAFFGQQLRPFGTLGHANLLGAYLAMAMPAVAYLMLRAIQRRRWPLVALLGCVGVVAVAALALTLSRAAWLATGCAGLILLLGWWGRARVASAVLLAVLLLCGVLGIAAYQTQALPASMQTALADRFRRLDDGAGRRDMWRAGWQIYLDHPVTGSGLDTFRLAFGAKRTPGYWEKDGDGTPTRAHNEVIHILATQGTLGGIALGVLLIGLVVAALQAWRRAEDRSLVTAIMASITAFGVTGLFGFTVIPTGSLFIVCAGLLSRWATNSEGEEEVAAAPARWGRWVTAGVAVVAMVVAWFGVIQPFRANRACHRGDRIADVPAKALSHYRQATDLDPRCDRYWVRLGDAAQREGLRTGSADALQQARAALERAEALVPADAYHHANLGRLLGELAIADNSLTEPARAKWREALALDPNSSCFLTEAARTALAVGDYEEAESVASRGAEAYPSWGSYHAQIGAAALAQGRLPDAIRSLERAVAAEWHADLEGRSRAFATLALAELRTRNYERVLYYADQASQGQPSWPTPHLIRGQALQALGRRDEATQAFRAAQRSRRHH